MPDRRLSLCAALALLLLLPGLPALADRGADGRFERRDSAHFILLQDVDIDRSSGFRGSRRFEREMLAELERAYDQLDPLLGLRPRRKIEVLVYDAALFDAQFAGLFRFGVAGFYGGVIRVRGDTLLTTALARTLRHELVHAALDAAAPSLALPAWLNEGLAEWFEQRSLGKRGLAANEWAVLGEARDAGLWVPLAELMPPNLSRLAAERAPLAYLESYALVDHLVRRAGPRSLPLFLERLLRFRRLDAALARSYRLTLAELEASLLAELP